MSAIADILNSTAELSKLDLDREERRKKNEENNSDLIKRLKEQRDYNKNPLTKKRRTYLSEDYPTTCTLHDRSELLYLLATTIQIAQYPGYHVGPKFKVYETTAKGTIARTNITLVCVVENTLNSQRKNSM
jgi:hypothetical protein